MFSGLVHAEKSVDQKGQQVVELAPEDFKPSFTKSTVIKLNAIVSRSLDVINEYDSIIGEMKQSSDPKSIENQIRRVDQLSEQSTLILTDMLAAEKELKASDEVYNSAILAGMKDFVSDVEREVTERSAKLAQSLSKR